MGVQPRFALGILAQLLLSGCGLAASNRQAGSAPPRSVELRAIREVRAEQNRAIAAGDADLAATFWTEDVTIRRALGQDVHGRTAYRQLFGRGLQLSGVALSLPDLWGFPVACVRHCLMARHCGVSDGERDGDRAPDQWISVSLARTR